MFIVNKRLHRTATMARFRVTDANAQSFAALRDVLDGAMPFLWLHGRRKSGKGYALSAILRTRLAAEPSGQHLYLDAAHLVFLIVGARRQGKLDRLRDFLTTASTLLLDDMEPLLHSPDHAFFLHDVLATRAMYHRPTIMTSRPHPALLSLHPLLHSIVVCRPIVGMSPLTRRERRAIVLQEAALLEPAVVLRTIPHLAALDGETDAELRRTVRRALFFKYRIAASDAATPHS